MRQRVTREHLKLAGQNFGQMNPPGRNPEQKQILAAINAFKNLGGKALQCARQILSRQNLKSFGARRVRHGAVSEPLQCMGVVVSKT